MLFRDFEPWSTYFDLAIGGGYIFRFIVLMYFFRDFDPGIIYFDLALGRGYIFGFILLSDFSGTLNLGVHILT